MSEFLVVVPPGWTQLDWAFISTNIPSMDRIAVENAINSNMAWTFEEPLKANGLIPEDKSVITAKLIDDTYFMVQLG